MDSCKTQLSSNSVNMTQRNSKVVKKSGVKSWIKSKEILEWLHKYNMTYQDFDVAGEECNENRRSSDHDAKNNSAKCRVHRSFANLDQIHHIVAQRDHN